MKHKWVDISEIKQLPPLRDLTAAEEAEIIAEYKATRTDEALEADYRDFDKQVAEGVPAEQLLQELEDDLAKG